MRKAIRKIVMFLGTLVLMLLIITGGVLVYFHLTAKRVPENTILEADFAKDYVEYSPTDSWERLIVGEKPLLRNAVEGILRASKDKRVHVLVARIGASGMELGKIQELRDAVMTFRKSGKTAIAFAETFGELGAGNGAYYLASAFDKIYLQPSGDVGLTGLRIKTPFLREFLAKIGIEPQFANREEYKSAIYTFTEDKYIAPQREEDQALLESLEAQIVRGIAEGRSLETGKVDSLIDRGPFTSKEALLVNLIDGLAYRDQVYEEARMEAGKGAQFLYLSEYLRRAGSLFNGKKKIAVVYGVGTIVRGKSRYTPLEHIMGSETVAASLRAAARDKSVKAIVFRINSPGGDYVAGDTIWREVVQAKRAGKPVIVSMSDVAASGGYFVAMPADKIIAHPGTITGSIGVFSGKMVTAELWQKIGVHWGEIFTHKNADLWSSMEKYTPEQWDLIQGWLDDIYRDFLTKASEGRNMDLESVRKAAKGRVWSGEDAKKLGLVDELGGFEVAIKQAKAGAGIPEKEEIGLKIFPPRTSLWRTLLSGEPENSQASHGSTDGLREYIEPWLTRVRGTGFFKPSGVLSMQERSIE